MPKTASNPKNIFKRISVLESELAELKELRKTSVPTDISNAQAVLSTLKSSIGLFPNKESGVKYTRKIRKSWDRKISTLWNEK